MLNHPHMDLITCYVGKHVNTDLLMWLFHTRYGDSVDIELPLLLFNGNEGLIQYTTFAKELAGTLYDLVVDYRDGRLDKDTAGHPIVRSFCDQILECIDSAAPDSDGKTFEGILLTSVDGLYQLVLIDEQIIDRG